MALGRSPLFDGVDPQLLQLIQSVGANYAPYKMNITSGYRPGDPRYHGSGKALDVQLIDPKTGVPLRNYQDPSQAQAYQQFANAVYNAAPEDLKAKLRWGGYFNEGGPGHYGALDLMHFDVGGDKTPMGGGSWATGFSPEQMKMWGLKDPGGIIPSDLVWDEKGMYRRGGDGAPTASANAIGPPMPRAPMDFTPEQRRQAIASIESQGSGDYGALGPWTGDPESGRDRAYGRYQMMGKNIPQWTQEVLGRAMTADEFMRDPKAQDAVFDKKFGEYVQKYGEAGAANMWFTGHPESVGRKDAFGTTDTSYEARYLKALGAPGKMGESYPDSMRPAPAGTAAPGTAVAGASPATAPQDKLAGKVEDIAGSVGDLFGAGGKSNQMPVARSGYTPTATTTMGEPAQTFNPQMADMQRQRLAMALQRLNSGKLY